MPVRGEFVRDGRELLGIEVRFIRRTEEIDPAWSGVYVTNYESVRDGRLAAPDPRLQGRREIARGRAVLHACLQLEKRLADHAALVKPSLGHFE